MQSHVCWIDIKRETGRICDANSRLDRVVPYSGYSQPSAASSRKLTFAFYSNRCDFFFCWQSRFKWCELIELVLALLWEHTWHTLLNRASHPTLITCIAITSSRACLILPLLLFTTISRASQRSLIHHRHFIVRSIKRVCASRLQGSPISSGTTTKWYRKYFARGNRERC